MSDLLPSECPNCGRMHEGHDFNTEPGPVQRDAAKLRVALEAWPQDGSVHEPDCAHFDENESDDACDCFTSIARAALGADREN